jgi:FtsH-binding integral membrane protein
VTSETKGLIFYVVGLWSIVLVALVAFILGDKDAINAVIGVTGPALLCTFFAWDFARQDRRGR